MQLKIGDKVDIVLSTGQVLSGLTVVTLPIAGLTVLEFTMEDGSLLHISQGGLAAVIRK